ncbi:hypothetical protein L596_016059 [Steinernema carpocapsae]|uniref:Uncharacterized protein n=1 Tax=Steinernema carpocapsae TaxID=34508 RepID=A0A4U5NGZ4_STECR|nr:hypothetical protein L596_016059 [Steinernema carpocapsae]
MATGDALTERQIETCVSRLAETRLAACPPTQTATASSPTSSSSQSFGADIRFCGFRRNSGAVMAISAKMSIRFVLLHPVATANEAGPTTFQAKFKDDGSGYCVQEQAQ